MIFYGGQGTEDVAITEFMNVNFTVKYLCHTTIQKRNACMYSIVVYCSIVHPQKVGPKAGQLQEGSILTQYHQFHLIIRLVLHCCFNSKSTLLRLYHSIIQRFGDTESHPARGCPAGNRLRPQMETPGRQQCYCALWHSNETGINGPMGVQESAVITLSANSFVSGAGWKHSFFLIETKF